MPNLQPYSRAVLRTVARSGPAETGPGQAIPIGRERLRSRTICTGRGELEKVLPYAATSSTVHELLGLVYASLNQSDKAMEQLKTAVQLKPDWVEATNQSWHRAPAFGKGCPGREQFRKALTLDPHSYDTNHNLGEFYAQSGKLAEARSLS